MQESDSMETHINHFCNMKDELVTASTIVLNAEATANLLGSLPTSYAGLVMAQTGQVGTLNETIQLLLEEDLRRKGEDTNRSSFALFGSQRPSSMKFNRHRTSQFGKSNQYKRKQFNKNNYNSQNSNINNYQRKFSIVCFHCGKPRHGIRDCQIKEVEERRSQQLNNTASNEAKLVVTSLSVATNEEAWYFNSGAS